MIRLAKATISEQEERMIEQVLNLLKEHPVVQALFEKYKIPLEKIGSIPIDFEEMDVSAKSKNGKITLNRNLLNDGNLIEDLHYVVHELVHVLQFLAGRLENMKIFDDKHYLDNPLEIDAFREQVRFIKEYKDDKEADDYIEQLLSFHGYKGQERKDKEKQLRGD